MARNREKIRSFVYQISENLKSKLAIGESKYQAKKDQSYNEKIYSWKTYRTYQEQMIYFTDFIKENFKDCKTLEQINSDMVNSYLQSRIDKGHSAYTLKLIVASISKITNLDRETFIKTPSRLRKDITRSRNGITKLFNQEKNKDLVEFCKSTGLRKSELMQIRGSDLEKVGDKYYLNVSKNTKGGRIRKSEIVGNIEKVVKLCQKADNEKVFSYVPKNCPVHNYRADYCKAIYTKYARNIRTLKKLDNLKSKEIYKCRLDKQGIIYDKKAMSIASENLGHSRIDVIATNYLH